MSIERVWCPYCHQGQDCTVNGTTIICPVCHRTFTIEESNNDIRFGKR